MLEGEAIGLVGVLGDESVAHGVVKGGQKLGMDGPDQIEEPGSILRSRARALTTLLLLLLVVFLSFENTKGRSA